MLKNILPRLVRVHRKKPGYQKTWKVIEKEGRCFLFMANQEALDGAGGV